MYPTSSNSGLEGHHHAKWCFSMWSSSLSLQTMQHRLAVPLQHVIPFHKKTYSNIKYIKPQSPCRKLINESGENGLEHDSQFYSTWQKVNVWEGLEWCLDLFCQSVSPWPRLTTQRTKESIINASNTSHCSIEVQMRFPLSPRGDTNVVVLSCVCFII